MYIALANICTGFGKKILFFILFTAGFILCGMTLICINISEYDRIQYKKQCDIYRTGCMLSGDMDSAGDNIKGMDIFSKHPFQKFYNKLKKSGLVEKCAQYTILGNSAVDESVVKHQAGHQLADYAETFDSAEVTYAQKDIFDIYGIKIHKRDKNSKIKTGDIVLGYNLNKYFKDADVINFRDQNRRIYGYMEKGAELSFEDMAYPDGVVLTGLYDLGYSFFYIMDENMYNSDGIHFRISGNVGRKEFKSKVKKLAADNETIIRSFYFMDERLDKLKKDNMNILGKVSEYAFFIFSSVILICAVFKIYEIIRNKRYYGILYASGMTGIQIEWIIIAENLIIILASFLTGTAVLYKALPIFCSYFGTGTFGFIFCVIKSVFIHRVLIEEFLLFMAVAAISSLIPAVYFSKISVRSMMKDFYE